MVVTDLATNPNIHIYHNGKFDSFNAGALRTSTLARALQLGGYFVTIISADPGPCEVRPEWAEQLHKDTTILGGGPSGDGPTRLLPRRLNPFSFTHADLETPGCIILFGATPPTYARAKRLSTHLGVPLHLDVDEWMGPGDFSLRSWLSMFPIRYELFMRRLPKLASSGFGISIRMTDHLAQGGARALCVPPLHEPIESEVQIRTDGLTRLLIPAVSQHALGKDQLSLNLVSDAILVDPTLARRLELHLMGDNNDPDAQRRVANLRELGTSIVEHGRVNREKAHAILRNVDWLVVLRSNEQRRLQYAFPSKATESLVAGTPLITNRFSDMGTVIQHGINGVLVDELTPASTARVLNCADQLHLSRQSVAAAAARYTPASQAVVLRDFLERVGTHS